MTVIRVIVAAILVLLATYVALMNLGGVIASALNQRKGIDKHYSTVPAISLILAAIAYPVYPFALKWWIGLIPVLDIGTWMLIIGLPWAIARGAFRKDLPKQS